MGSGGSQTVQQEIMQMRLERDRTEGCDRYRSDFFTVQSPTEILSDKSAAAQVVYNLFVMSSVEIEDRQS